MDLESECQLLYRFVELRVAVIISFGFIGFKTDMEDGDKNWSLTAYDVIKLCPQKEEKERHRRNTNSNRMSLRDSRIYVSSIEIMDLILLIHFALLLKCDMHKGGSVP
jgi:hypothetical protein